MYKKLAQELAFYAYRLSEAQRAQAEESIIEYWDAKYHGLARGIQIVTSDYPYTARRGEYGVEVNIGDYQTVVTFN